MVITIGQTFKRFNVYSIFFTLVLSLSLRVFGREKKNKITFTIQICDLLASQSI